MKRIVRTTLWWTGMVLIAAAAAGAQSLGEAARRAKEQQKASSGTAVRFDDRDIDPRLAAQEVFDYEITDERWRRFLAAQIWVNQTVEKDAALMQRLSELKTRTARALERAIAREPSLTKALASAGSDAHDFAFTQVALTVALLLNQDQRLVEQLGQLTPATQANMSLVKAHAAELKQMQAVAAALKGATEK